MDDKQTPETNLDELISEDWLREVGFKWHQLERQPDKQWILWLGDACGESGCIGSQELGIEVTKCSSDNAWFCWLRSDLAGRYSRFLHIRHLRLRRELTSMISGLTGQDWNPENNVCGSMLRPQIAALRKKELQRLDVVLLQQRHPWCDIEKDDSRGGALPEHMQLAINARKAQ